MAKKEINVYSVSFLDLLSGALAAVIILFVIVPKMTSQQQEIVEVVDSLNVQVDELDSLVELAQNCVPDSTFERIQSEIDEIRSNLEEVRDRVVDLEQELENTQERNRQLENQLVQTEERIEDIENQLENTQNRPTQEELEELQDQLAEAREELEEQREQAAQGAGGAGASMFGVNAKFAVVCDWAEDIDVDLYLKNTNNKWIYFSNTSEDFGSYLGDVISRSVGDGKFEMIYQEDRIVPGTYEVWYHVYKPGVAKINGFAVIHPFTSQEQKIKFDVKTLNYSSNNPINGGGFKVGTLRVTENSITIN